MVKSWKKPFKDREELRTSLGPAGLLGHLCLWLGIVFAVLGVISDAVNITLGLEPTSWLLLAIVVDVASIPYWLLWVLAMHLLGIEAEAKKE